MACVCLPSKGCLNFFLICFSAWLSNQNRFSASFWITVYFYPNMKLRIKDAGTMLATTMFLDWCYRKIWCQGGVKNKTVFSSAKYQWGLSSPKQAFQTLEAQISYERFFFSTRIESRSKFKSPGAQTAPWLHWIWSDSTAGLNPKATSWVKFLWTQLEFLIKTKLMNVVLCWLLQLAHLHFSRCLITVLIIQQLGSPFHLPRLSIFRQILSTAYVRCCHFIPSFPPHREDLGQPCRPWGNRALFQQHHLSLLSCITEDK